MFENINRHRVHPLKQLANIVLIILIMLLLQLFIFCLVYWSLPNTWSSPFFSSLQIYASQSTLGLADIYSVIIKEPLLIYEELDLLTDDPLWSVYFYPWSSLLFLLVTFSVYLLVPVRSGKITGQSEMKRSGLIFLLMLLLTQMQNIECCGSGPAWLIEVWFRTKVFAVNVNSWIDWTFIYNIFYVISDAMHVMLIVLVIGLLVRQVYSMKKTSDSMWF